MEFDIVSASDKLSELEISFTIDDLRIEILWYRAMIHEGQWRIDRHKHSSFEFHFIASGQCKVIHDNGEFIVNSGDFYITAPGVYHVQENTNTEKFVEYCINCELNLEKDEHGESRYIIDILKNSPCMKLTDTEDAIGLFEKVLNEAFCKKFGFYNNIKSLTTIIISMAARNLSNNNNQKYQVPLKKGKDNYRLEQIRRYIEDNITDNITTGGIANVIFLSERQICRIIKQMTGYSTKEYISSIKLQKAKDLLRHSNMNIKEISAILGFSSEYYFSQFFKNIEGYSPSQFRIEVKKMSENIK